MNIIFSHFTIDMYARVNSLWQACDGIGLSDADSRDNIRSYLERNPEMSFVAIDNGKIVGSILSGHDGRRGFIHHLAVDVEYRRQRIASRLVEKSLTVLKSAGIQKCHLFIFNNNTGGIKFWKKIGWTYRSDINVISKEVLS